MIARILLVSTLAACQPVGGTDPGGAVLPIQAEASPPTMIDTLPSQPDRPDTGPTAVSDLVPGASGPEVRVYGIGAVPTPSGENALAEIILACRNGAPAMLVRFGGQPLSGPLAWTSTAGSGSLAATPTEDGLLVTSGVSDFVAAASATARVELQARSGAGLGLLAVQFPMSEVGDALAQIGCG